MDLNTSRNISIFKFLNPFSASHKTAGAELAGDEQTNLLQCIKAAREEWLDAERCFDYADSEEITDYCTYKLKACEVRYDYFLKKAKKMGLKTVGLDTAGVTYMSGKGV